MDHSCIKNGIVKFHRQPAHRVRRIPYTSATHAKKIQKSFRARKAGVANVVVNVACTVTAATGMFFTFEAARSDGRAAIHHPLHAVSSLVNHFRHRDGHADHDRRDGADENGDLRTVVAHGLWFHRVGPPGQENDTWMLRSRRVYWP